MKGIPMELTNQQINGIKKTSDELRKICTSEDTCKVTVQINKGSIMGMSVEKKLFGGKE
jgi:hypothetical protein